jgi:hypothetical protein
VYEKVFLDVSIAMVQEQAKTICRLKVVVAYLQVVSEKVEEQVQTTISNEFCRLRAGCIRKGVPWCEPSYGSRASEDN